MLTVLLLIVHILIYVAVVVSLVKFIIWLFKR